MPSPVSQVTRTFTACPRCRTQDTTCRSSGLSARAPCTMKVRCSRAGIGAGSWGRCSRARREPRCSMTAGSPGFHQGPRSPWQSDYHSPALAGEVVTLLGGAALVLDGTLGGGGHAAALLESGVERVIGIDRDPDALAEAGARLAHAAARGRFAAYRGNYAAIDAIPAIADLRFNGILLDLGISSHQIDDASRGFSFREGAPLDMRMGGALDAAPSAEELLGSASHEELVRIFRLYGDEPRAARLAREIVRRRATRPFRTSDDLVGAIRGALGARTGPRSEERRVGKE